MAYDAIKKAKTLLVQKVNVEKAKLLLVRKENVERQNKPLLVRKENVESEDKSKLMVCIEVLCILVANGPMELTQLLEKFEMDKCNLEPNLRLLWDRGLVEEEKFGDTKIHYAVTERGQNVLKVIGPLIKEAHKIQMHEFELITNALSGAGYS